ncbi:MAG: hypothetical protein LAT81_12065, partial [Oceanicaulis sp.]|nr:hypothetical protein [Oceanicaulis sp.]
RFAVDEGWQEPVVEAGVTQPQINRIQFHEVQDDIDYTITINGNAYTARNGDNWDLIIENLSDDAFVGLELETVREIDGLSGVDVQDASADTLRTIDLSSLSVEPGVIYTLEVGSDEFETFARNDDDISDIAARLASQADDFEASADGAVIELAEGAGELDVEVKVSDFDPGSAETEPHYDGSDFVGRTFDFGDVNVAPGVELAVNVIANVSGGTISVVAEEGQDLADLVDELEASFKAEFDDDDVSRPSDTELRVDDQDVFLSNVSVDTGAASDVSGLSSVVYSTARDLDLSSLDAVEDGRYSVEIDDQVFTYAAGDESLAQIVAGLAADIDDHDDYHAVADGEILSILRGATDADISVDAEITAVESPGTIRSSTTGQSDQRVLSFNDVRFVDDAREATYTLTLGGDTHEVSVDNDDLDEVFDLVEALASEIGSAEARELTAGGSQNFWNGLFTVLDDMITAGEGGAIELENLAPAQTDDLGVVQLTASEDNTPFELGPVHASPIGALSNNGVTSADPGNAVIDFADFSGSDDFTDDIVVVINGTEYRASGLQETDSGTTPSLELPEVDPEPEEVSLNFSTSSDDFIIQTGSVDVRSGHSYTLTIEYTDPDLGSEESFTAFYLADDTSNSTSLAGAFREQIIEAADAGSVPFDVDTSAGTDIALSDADMLNTDDVTLEEARDAVTGTVIEFGSGSLSSGEVIEVRVGDRSYRVQVGAGDYGQQVSGMTEALETLESQISEDFGEDPDARDWSLEVQADTDANTLSIIASTTTEDFFAAIQPSQESGAGNASPLLSSDDVRRFSVDSTPFDQVLDDLADAISADGYSVETTSSGLEISGGSGTLNVEKAWLAISDGVWDVVERQPAGEDRKQQSLVEFDPVAFEDGDSFSIDIDGVQLRVDVGAEIDDSTVTRTAGSVLGAFEYLINNSEDLDLDVTVDAGARTLQLDAVEINTAFQLENVSIVGTTTQSVSNALGNNPGVPLQEAGSSAQQVSEATFGSAGEDPDPTVRYQITIGGERFQAQPDQDGVGDDWNSVLGALASAIDAADVGVEASHSGRTITLTAEQADSAFDFNAIAEDTGLTSGDSLLEVDGDYVLIVPERDPGAFGVEAEGNLVVVALPVHSGENIVLGSEAGDVVVVSDMDVGGGTIDMYAREGGIALGGEITAGELNLESRDELTVTSMVNEINVEMTGAGNLTVSQDDDLVVNSLENNGGDVRLVVDGDLTLRDFSGDVGDLTIRATGDVTFEYSSGFSGDMAAVERMDIEAGGAVSGLIQTGRLHLETTGPVDLDNQGTLVVEQLHTGGGAVELRNQGDVHLQSEVGVTGSGVLDLRAEGGGSLIVEHALYSDTGPVELHADDLLHFAPAASIDSPSGLVNLEAGGDLIMDADTFIRASSGQIALEAGGDLQLGKLRTEASGDLVVTTGGELIDAGNGDLDIIAVNADLVMTAVDGIANDGDELDIAVASVDLVNTGTSGDISFRNHGDLMIERIFNAGEGGITSVSTFEGNIGITGAGIVSASAELDVYAGAGQLITDAMVELTGDGDITLTGEQSDLVLADGVRVSGDGDIRLIATDGAVINDPDQAREQWLLDEDGEFHEDIEWAMLRGYVAVEEATGRITVTGMTDSEMATRSINNSTVLREGGGVFLSIEGDGRLSIEARTEIGQGFEDREFSPLAMVVDAREIAVSSSERADVSLLTTGNSAVVGADRSETGSRGGSTGVSSLGDEQTISAPMDAGGENLRLIGNVIHLDSSVRSAGAELSIRPLDPTREIVLGGNGQSTNGNGALGLSAEELARLEAGFGQIVIGSMEGSSHIYIMGNGDGDTTPVQFHDDLSLLAPGEGGEVFVQQALLVDGNVYLLGSGNTTTISDDITASGELMELDDSFVVDGDITLTAGTDGSAGNIVLGSDTFSRFIRGAGESGSDTLTLDAQNGGNIEVLTSIGGDDRLDGLHVEAANNVTFEQSVNLSGDLVINATGTVRFEDGINLQDGGSLIINGAEIVSFAESSASIELEGGGDLLIEADRITLPHNGAIEGTGEAVLRPTDLGRPIEVAQPPLEGGATSHLLIRASELALFGSDFERLVIGHEDQGQPLEDSSVVRIGAVDNTQRTFWTHVEIFGDQITLERYS